METRMKDNDDEVFEVGDPAVIDQPVKRPTNGNRGAALPWVLFVLTLGAAGAGTWFYVLPQKEALALAETQRANLQAENDMLKKRAAAAEADAKALADKSNALEEDVQKKEAVLKELTSTKDELELKLKDEIARGDVAVKQFKGEIVVDLVDQILFPSGEAELNEKGKAVLKQVGETLAKVPDKVLQIGGHTGNAPITGKLKDKFSSNWELSAQRALNVVHFLQDEVKLPGERLIASGYSEFKPLSKNSSKDGRKRNRRIEVTLLARK